ncbi:MAG TPA: alcohol dehydrogenase catalytic domain-containing protein [Firmicutes bacterium]|nr:alcohol dehydrogenase catalytic domain-containing protein [Bacillota bacterium]
MKAAIFAGNGRFEIREVPLPEIPEGWARVKVGAAGICGSDLHIIRGEHPVLPDAVGHILGHENAGVVTEIAGDGRWGGGGAAIAEGDRVGIEPLTTCGECVYCRTGYYYLCESLKHVGIAYPGGFAEYTVAPVNKLYRLPEGLAFTLASLLDPLAVAVHAVNVADVGVSDRVLVYGDGPVALCIIGVLNVMGVRDISIVGHHDRNLRKATSMGAVCAVNSRRDSSRDGVSNDVSGYGEADAGSHDNGGGARPCGNVRGAKRFDVVFQCVGGGAQVMRDLIPRVERLGRVVLLGIATDLQLVPAFEVMAREIRIIGSNSYGYFRQRPEFEIALEMLDAHKLLFSHVITHEISLDEIEKGFEMLTEKDKSGAIKVVVVPR